MKVEVRATSTAFWRTEKKRGLASFEHPLPVPNPWGNEAQPLVMAGVGVGWGVGVGAGVAGAVGPAVGPAGVGSAEPPHDSWKTPSRRSDARADVGFVYRNRVGSYQRLGGPAPRPDFGQRSRPEVARAPAAARIREVLSTIGGGA